MDGTMRTGFTLAFLASLAACGAPVASRKSGEAAVQESALADVAESETDLKALYRMALEDAAIADPDEVHPLNLPRGESVTVLSWVKNEFLKYYPVDDTTSFSRFTWVTLAPEVQDKCRRFKTEDLLTRLQQLLGLPPDHHEVRSFVVMEVNRANLFRPCIDPDISVPQCAAGGETDDGAHGLFLANQTATAYSTPPGYPWTRLGYTYDWNPRTPEYGASEYVIAKNATVTIQEVISTEKYCAP